MNTEELKKLAMAATPGPWMHLFGDRHVYDRMEDGCRGNPVVGVDFAVADVRGNLDYVAAANPATILALIAERDELAAKLDRAQAEIRALESKLLEES